MLQLADWPSSSVPPGAYSDINVLDGRVVKTSLQRGEPVIESKLAPVGTKGGLSAVVTEGKRAITVRVNDVVGVAGFALPGNYVDIMVSTQQDHSGGNSKDQTISKIVLEKILVLAVAQEASRDETKPKVVNAVTLEVTPEQAEKLDVARSVGTLSLVLRNQMDGDDARTAGARKQDLFHTTGGPAPKAKAAKVGYRPKPIAVTQVTVKPEKHKVEMIKGMHKSAVEF
jgi:pilus assembly protein CpaB